MALRINLNDINSLEEKEIFLDTNIWIYLFCSIVGKRKFIADNYAKAFKVLIHSKQKLWTDISVLSEFVNRYLRDAFGIYKTNNGKGEGFQYKRDYQKTDDFKENLQSVVSTVKNKILAKASVANLAYENEDMEELIGNLEDRLIDFNDLHIERLCEKNGFMLLTNDGDYAGSSLDIISGNPKLLKAERKR